MGEKGWRHWTKDEDEFLINNWHKKGADYCAKKLNRSCHAISSRAYVLGLGGCVGGSGYLTGRDIAKVMGIHKDIVQDWLKAGLIKHKLAPVKLKTYFVKLSDLEDFLKNNQDLWDSRKLTVSIWRTKPVWLKEKMQNDELLPLKIIKNDSWSTQKIKKLLDMAETGDYSYKQMGEILGKTYKAVGNKLMHLRKEARYEAEIDVKGAGAL